MSANAAQPDEPPEPHDQPEHADSPVSPVVPALEELLACLRRLAGPCEPPVGVGAFDILYASAREVVVWYSPVRPEHQPGEVTIPGVWLAAAWEALAGGESLGEASLAALCDGRAGGARWVQALLAQAPGVAVQEVAEGALALSWSVAAWQTALKQHQGASGEGAKATARTRSRRGRSQGTNGP